MSFGNIILIWGDAGTGKTWNSQKFPEPIAHLDFEFPRAKKTFEIHHSDRLIEIIPCASYYEKSDRIKKIHAGDLDVLKTFELIENTSYDVLDTFDSYETIIMDSISGLRNDIVKEKWMYDNPLPNGKKRDSIGKNNLGAWAEINDMTKSLVFPIINRARQEDKTVILIAGTKAEYRIINNTDGTQGTAPAGNNIMDCKKWFTFKVDTIIELSTLKGRRYMEIPEKSLWGIVPKIDITDSNVYGALHGMGYL